jgi:hypothetical protein
LAVLLVTNGLVVVSQHVQAANVEDLIELGGSSLVLGAGDSARDRGSGRLIGKVRLLGSPERGSGRERPGSREASGRAQPCAGTENRGHCEL